MELKNKGNNDNKKNSQCSLKERRTVKIDYEYDLFASKIILGNLICFHCQTNTQKYLKDLEV